MLSVWNISSELLKLSLEALDHRGQAGLPAFKFLNVLSLAVQFVDELVGPEAFAPANRLSYSTSYWTMSILNAHKAINEAE